MAKIKSILAEKAIVELLEKELVDRGMKIQRSKNNVLIPLKGESVPEELKSKYQIQIEEIEDQIRGKRERPFDLIKRLLLKRGLSKNIISNLPDKWELFGDILVLRFPKELENNKREIAEEYARVLKAKTVLQDISGIHSEERLPVMNRLVGSETVTIHRENGISYCFDVEKIMFSSGNIDERIRMSTVNCDDEIVIDMFAGIGYFALPMAVHIRPRRIYACEIRKLSFDYLLKNIELNSAGGVIKPFLGDSRDFDPPEQVDRIVMGYLKDTHLFLPKALSCLKPQGIIHYHENCPTELFPDRPIDNIRKACGEKWELKIISKRIVKSFSPGVSHVVIDGKFTLS